ncbi:MAG TPA: hypothetical protein VMT39_03265 [Candidatus Bathyarchaeia archaeon]|nr:hypothetical protein [Candidatus Bathyarchaeia archaeon]
MSSRFRLSQPFAENALSYAILFGGLATVVIAAALGANWSLANPFGLIEGHT